MANKALKGITIEIGGDTTKLDKAISGVEGKTRSLQTELRQVERLLKFDPSNTELLSQKQDILTDSIKGTAEKLDTLKEAEKQVQEQFKKGEVSEDQVRALKREIIKTESALSDMKTELNQTETALNNLGSESVDGKKDMNNYEDAVENAKKDLDDFKQSASDTFDTLKTGATVLGGAVVATGGYAVKVATDFDKAYNTLQTQTGATNEEMDELNTSMESIYSNNFGESIADVASSMATVKQKNKLSGDALQDATEYALLMRDTFDFDVNESTRSAKMLMDQYGLSAEDAYNLIAQGAQNGLNKNGDLLDTINEYGVHFASMGLSAEDMFNMLANGADSGTFSVDKLGDAVKEFGIRAKDGSDTTADAFATLGLDVDETSLKFANGGEGAKEALSEVATALFNMEDPIARNQAGVALFGTMWEDLGEDGIKALMDLDGGISTTKSSLDDINNQKYNDIGSALQGLGRTLETDVIKPLGDELTPVIEDVIGYIEENGDDIKDVLSNVVDAVGDFVGFIVDNGDVLLSVIAGIGAGMIAWNVATMINGVVGAIKAYQLANEGATIAQALFNGVLNANPLMLIITAITAVVVAIGAFILTNEDARKKIAQVWEAIKHAFGVVLDAVAGFFSSAWESIKLVWAQVQPYFTAIWESIKLVFSVVSEWLGGVFSKAWSGIKIVWDAVGGYFKNIWATIKGVFSVVKAVLSGNWSDAWTAIKKIVSTWKEYFSGIWTSIKGVFSGVKDWFKGIFSGAWEAVKGVFSSWSTFFSGLWSNIKTTFSTIGTNIASAISGAVKSGINGVISMIENTINSGINLINGAVDLINKIPGVEIDKFNNLSLPRLARGGIVTGPTLAEIGEDGAEAVIPLENNTQWLNKVAQQLNDHLSGGATSEALLSKLDNIYERLDRLQIVLDTGALVGETIDKIDAGLATKQLLSARGV